MIGTLFEMVRNHSLHPPDPSQATNGVGTYGSYEEKAVNNKPDAESDSAPLLNTKIQAPLVISQKSESVIVLSFCSCLISRKYRENSSFSLANDRAGHIHLC